MVCVLKNESGRRYPAPKYSLNRRCRRDTGSAFSKNRYMDSSNHHEMSVYPHEERGEIILYQPDSSLKLEVRLENETVWLTQAQIATLFGRDQSVISRHINSVFKEKELDKKSNMHFLHITNIDRPVAIYSLDVIISVGYRVKSQQGTSFRRWATRILKEYLLRGYAINQRIERVEKFAVETEKRVAETEKKIEFFVKTSLPPVEGIFYDGQVFDAYAFVSGLIKSAKRNITLIDNYADESVLLLLSKRASGVEATVYTAEMTPRFRLDLKKHNAQYPPVDVRIFARSHDRFLFIDGDVYHIGASLKDMGRKWFAFSKMNLDADTLLQNIH
jgi:hypothetical protein